MQDEPTGRARVEPVPGEPAAIGTVGGDRALLVADYHAGYEAGLRDERGVDVPSRAPERRERLLDLLDRTDADQLVVCGDLMHSIGDPGGAERGELEVLLESIPQTVDVTVVKGNHDGKIETWFGDGDGNGGDGGDGAAAARHGPADEMASVTVVPGDGIALDSVGVCHGHTWPAPELLACDVLCLGHEHPCVRLEDEVGGSRVERAWLRGRVDPTPFREYDGYEDADASWLDGGDEDGASPPRLVVIPAFNDLVGGTWVNVPNQSFLSPFLPEGLADGEAYLLDGTRLGPYGSV